ncbi:K+/H+ antiporter YhaU regulatory subunit KhtT [Catalinimonas alkaloidigena]|uniref:TrkA C-terminal domain-containing protein n=1 Tax=Catalinimonas alkaloidigena TaxID=1075417 RepID=UPI0024072B0C|nr:TrkA C-terminal domain-containing protein [Catalinimonas alkaloidigena]MDF9795244.1 K+/H+ antiporter YhaU regulatory subunit KhtT [Catalinimonas alkaloidigena]
MTSVLTLIIIISISILVTRFATMSLIHTGLSEQTARFQARSAFTGVGFTTRESERIVAHPVRRRIIMVLMLLGNVGIVSVLATLVLTFVDDQAGASEWLEKMATLIGGLGLIWGLSKSKWVDRGLSRWINHLLNKYTDIKVRDYAGILHLSGEYEITEMLVDSKHWMTDKPLRVLNLRQEGLNLIGVEREDRTYVGLPNGDTVIREGDTLILYGRESALKLLSERKKGRAGVMNRQQAISENMEAERREAIAEQKSNEATKV